MLIIGNSSSRHLAVLNFLDIVALKQACPLWKRLMHDLSKKQQLHVGNEPG